MELKNLLTPWNWFKKEEESRATQRGALSKTTDHPLSRFHSDIDKLFESFFKVFLCLLSGKRGEVPGEG